MTESSPMILIVDDEAEMRELHQLLLLDAGFQVMSAEDGKKAIELVEKEGNKIDIILSDVVMPSMDGYELCKYIKTHDELPEIPFIFISSLETLEEKTKGFECGADDYVTKPLQPKELSYKIKNLLELNKRNTDLNKQVMDSQTATMQIMNFYGDLGQILEFYKVSIGAKSFSELSEQLFEVTRAYNLSCSIQFHLPEEILSFGDKGEISPLEANVIELARKKERFFTFDARLVINYDTFSLLIKNMPIDDLDRIGSLRDSLGVLCNAVEARVSALIVEKIDARKAQIVDVVQEVLGQTKATFKDIEQSNIGAIEGMMDDIESAFFALGLSEPQEDRIRQIVKACMDNTNKAFQKGLILNAMFDDITENLQAITDIKK